MGERAGAVALELLESDRAPALVHDRVGIVAGDRVHVHLEVLGPQPQSGLTGELGVVGDDVHLGVVQQRVSVQIGRPDREPPIVDDPHLGVDVQMVVPMAAPRADGRGEQPAGVVVGSDELSELAHRVVVPVVRLRRQQHDDPELVTGRPAELVGQQVDDLRCPQKLVLQVDEALGAADRAHIALEDAELTYRDGLVHVLGDGPHDLDRGMAGSGGRRRSLEPLAAELTPPQREVVVYVEDGGTSNPGAHVVPAEPPASGVVAGVEPITP